MGINRWINQLFRLLCYRIINRQKIINLIKNDLILPRKLRNQRRKIRRFWRPQRRKKTLQMFLRYRIKKNHHRIQSLRSLKRSCWWRIICPPLHQKIPRILPWRRKRRCRHLRSWSPQRQNFRMSRWCLHGPLKRRIFWWLLSLILQLG